MGNSRQRNIGQSHWPINNKRPFAVSVRIIMDGWMDGWMDAWMDGWMDRQTDRQMDG